jgi:signal peptidase
MEAVLEQPVRLRRLGATTSVRKFRLAGWVVFVAIVAAWAIFLRPDFLGGPASYVIVAGHSMEPTLHTGDLVVARRQHTYRRGDVIAYHIMKNQAGAGSLVIHRIVGGSSQDGYVTRGDNRSYRDPWRPRPVDIAGEMKLHVPRLGLLPVFAHTPLGMAFIAALAGLLVLRGGTRTRTGDDAAPRSEVLAADGGGEEPDGVRADVLAHTPEPPAAHELQPTAEAGNVESPGPPALPPAGDELMPAADDEREDWAEAAGQPLDAGPASAETPPGLPEVDPGSLSAPTTAGHLLFAWTPTGYELVERDGDPPAVGAVLDESERLYRVSKLAGSPLPADPRPCAYLESA